MPGQKTVSFQFSKLPCQGGLCNFTKVGGAALVGGVALKQETKTAIDNLIRDTLWNGLLECYDELSISSCRQKIYEYVYTRYKDVA